VLAVGLLVAVLLSFVAATGTAAAQTAEAPDCSTVDYDGEGTEANPYEAEDLNQLQCIEEHDLSANYTLNSDIDASKTEEWNDGAGFEPIGNETNPFTGTFDGANHTITGLTINRPNESQVALFSILGEIPEETNIRDIDLVRVEINGASSVGSLVGRNEDGTVERFSASGRVTGDEDVGGLIGVNSHIVSKSSANVEVTGSTNVGGLIGKHVVATVQESSANGDVKGSFRVGGLVGYDEDVDSDVLLSSFRGSSASGDVNGSSSVGGLIGEIGGSKYTRVIGSTASGDVNGSSQIGGLVGHNSGDSNTFRESSASGDVNGSSQIGGLVGQSEGRHNKLYALSASGDVTGSSSVGGLIGEFGSYRVEVSDSSASGRVTGDEDVGGLIGINYISVIQSSASGSVTGEKDVGGLIGDNHDVVRMSKATGDVDGNERTGGLIGKNSGTADKSYATGIVTGTTSVGGLVGSNQNNVKESYATGEVTSDNEVGGLIGLNDSGTVTDAYWDTETTEQSSSAGGTGLTTEEMNGEEATENMEGFDFSETWVTTSSYPRFVDLTVPVCSEVKYDGEGTERNPYEVGNVEQLQCVTNQGSSANYTLVSDIDASETDKWNINNGFRPINSFTGTFDGAGYDITDLTIRWEPEPFSSEPGSDIGLFGTVGSNGTVENVHLENVDVAGYSGVSTLVGDNSGTVRNSSASGDIEASRNFEDLIFSGDVEGAAPPPAPITGGLVAFNKGTLTGSSARVNITSSQMVGGLVGRNQGTVEDSYTTGSVDGSRGVGGLVGVNEDGTVEDSYAAGRVNAFKMGGGLVGINEDEGTVTDAYWDMNATGQTSSAGGTGLTTEEMTCEEAPENMGGFDFTDTWVTTSKYPVLVWQVEDGEMRSAVDCVVEEDEEAGDGSDEEMRSGQNTGEGGEMNDESDAANNESNESSQPTPGFTAAAALLTLAAGVAVIVRRKRR